ncbi:MAG: hypothetical protein K2Q45_06740 [Nitrosomonas sp.]|nr:hypothetical protein [Nitrosomonas sp.]
MDLIHDQMPTDYLKNELAAWGDAATARVEFSVVLGMEAGCAPANKDEQEAFAAWKVMLRIVDILVKRGEMNV